MKFYKLAYKYLSKIMLFEESLRLFKLKPFSLFLSLICLVNSSSRILSSERNVNSLVKAFKTALSNFPLLKLLNLQEVYRE